MGDFYFKLASTDLKMLFSGKNSLTQGSEFFPLNQVTNAKTQSTF